MTTIVRKTVTTTRPPPPPPQARAMFQPNGVYSRYRGVTWGQLLDLVLLGYLTQDEAERIFYLQYGSPPPTMVRRGGRGSKADSSGSIRSKKCRKAGCDCDDEDQALRQYRRMKDVKKSPAKKSNRTGGSLYGHHRYRYQSGRPYWYRRRYGWYPVERASYRQLLAYGMSAALARAILAGQYN